MTQPRPGSLASRLVHGRRGTVIVVEDEPDIAGFLAAFFRASGTDVVHVDPSSPADVIQAAAAVGASCLLVDLNLTGTTGFDVIEAVHADERVAGIPVIIVSADARAATQEHAAALGAIGFIPKPFNVKDLYTTVEAVVDAREESASADNAPGADPAAAAMSATALVSAETLQHRLDAALDDDSHRGATTTFGLLRVAGPAASPVVMAEVARLLEPAFAAGTVLGATAADELALVFPGMGADAVQAALLDGLSDPDGQVSVDLSKGRTVTVGIRVGLAACPADGTTGDELYMAADIALAQAVQEASPVVTAAQTAR